MTVSTLFKVIEEPSPRWLISFGLAIALLLFLPASSLEFRVLAAWDAGVLCLLILSWLMMLSSNSTQTRERAQRQELDHRGMFLFVVFAAFASLFAIAGVLAKNKDSFTPEVVLSIGAILCSWLLMQTMFTLHYAAFYYRKVDRDFFRSDLRTDLVSSELRQADSLDASLEMAIDYFGGLQFADGKPPAYLDFVYFAFVLGMTSQTSDTMITTSAMRRLALGHTIVSFYFYSVILALSVSIISGLL